MNKVKIGLNVFAMVILFIMIFLMINYLSFRHYKRVDLTKAQIFTLSEKTKNVVKNLDKELKITVFLTPRQNPAVYRNVQVDWRVYSSFKR